MENKHLSKAIIDIDVMKGRVTDRGDSCSRQADGERSTKGGRGEGGRHTGEIKHDVNRVRRREYEHTQRQKIEVAVSQGSRQQNPKSSYENSCRKLMHLHKQISIFFTRS